MTDYKKSLTLQFILQLEVDVRLSITSERERETENRFKTTNCKKKYIIINTPSRPISFNLM